MKKKTETTILSKVEISFAGTTFNIEGSEAFVREGWEYLKNDLMPYLKGRAEEKPAKKEAKAVEKRGMAKLEKEKLEGKIEKVSEQGLLKFYNEKRPKTLVANVAVFAYYLKHFRKKEEFTRKDIQTLYEDIKLPLPKGYRQAIWEASRKRGFVVRGSRKRGTYTISEAGERFVEEQLPSSIF